MPVVGSPVVGALTRVGARLTHDARAAPRHLVRAWGEG